MSEYEFNREPICPYCNKVATIDAWELGLDDDQDTCEIECDHCEETIVVQLELTVEYSTFKPKGEQPTDKGASPKSCDFCKHNGMDCVADTKEPCEDYQSYQEEKND